MADSGVAADLGYFLCSLLSCFLFCHIRYSPRFSLLEAKVESWHWPLNHDSVVSSTPFFLFCAGEGQVVAVADSGVDADLGYFRDPTVATPFATVS